MKPVTVLIEDVIDLHTFRPDDVTDLLDEYFSACIERGIFSVRVVHGKGTGMLKKRVHSVLEKHHLVACYKDAPSDAGGWGATIVELSISKVI